LIDYEAFCGIIPPSEERLENQYQITPTELKERLDRGENIFLLDVREPQEVEICNLDGYVIPINDLPSRAHELDSSREMVVYCHVGTRSARAVEFLKQAGFRKIRNLSGGIDAWGETVDRSMPRY
jgi:adenylyltransferase/sulfurtransferase